MIERAVIGNAQWKELQIPFSCRRLVTPEADIRG